MTIDITDLTIGSDWRYSTQSRVVGNVNAARKFRKFTDVTFVVGPDEEACTIKAHKVVLGTGNDVLAKLISECEDGWIRIEDVSPKGFKNLIRYYYDADVKFTDLSSVLETFEVAEKFRAHKLKLAAENCLGQAVHYESTLEMLQISIQFDLPELRWKCINIISAKYQDLLRSDEFVSAPFKVVETILKHACHGEDCQYYALEAIGKWKNKHKADPKQVERLLKCVDFSQLKMCFFNDFIQENAGILSIDDLRAFHKYILSKGLHNPPDWYRSENLPLEEDCKTNTEALKEDTPELTFPEKMETQKLKVQKALDQELRYMEETLMEAADVSVEFYEMGIKETAKAIVEYFSHMIKEAVETSVEGIEDDMKYLDQVKEKMKKVIKSAHGENDTTMEVASASDIAMLPKTECDSPKGSDAVLKCTDFVEACESVNVKRSLSLLTECN